VYLASVAAVAVLGPPAHAIARSKPYREVMAPQPISLAQTPQPNTQIDVLVIEASNSGHGIAPELQNISQLTRPPFSAYSRLLLASHNTVPLGPTPSTVSLGGADSVTVAAPSIRPTGRYDVSVDVTRGGRTHNMHFGASPNTPFFTVLTTGESTARILLFIVH
jgi:hypothetical protein